MLGGEAGWFEYRLDTQAVDSAGYEVDEEQYPFWCGLFPGAGGDDALEEPAPFGVAMLLFFDESGVG